MSKREEIRKKRQLAARRQQMIIIGVVAVIAIGVAAALAVPRIIDSLQPVGSIVTPDPEAYPSASGKSLGPSDARVVVQEFSDFQ